MKFRRSSGIEAFDRGPRRWSGLGIRLPVFWWVTGLVLLFTPQAQAREDEGMAVLALGDSITAGGEGYPCYREFLRPELEKLAKRLDPQGRRVVLVNQAEGFDWKTDTKEDKVHPNEAGAGKMARRWCAAIDEVLRISESSKSTTTP